MTASMVHVTNLIPPGSDNPIRVYGQKHELTTASMVHVFNLTPPGSECNPTCCSLEGIWKFISRATRRSSAAAAFLSVGWSLPGVRLVTWTILAAINWSFDCKINNVSEECNPAYQRTRSRGRPLRRLQRIRLRRPQARGRGR
jgi:hypothetical protein